MQSGTSSCNWGNQRVPGQVDSGRRKGQSVAGGHCTEVAPPPKKMAFIEVLVTSSYCPHELCVKKKHWII